MRFFRIRLAASVLAWLGCMGSGVLADRWQGLVIGDTGGGAAQAFADAYYAGAAVEAWTGRAPVLLRNADFSEAVEALEGLRGAERVVLYFAGPAGAGGQFLADGRALALDASIAALADAGLTHLLLLVENCSRYDGRAFALPDLPERPGLALAMASSGGTGESCPAAGARLSDRLKRAAKAAETGPAEVLQVYMKHGSLDQLAGLGAEPAKGIPAAGDAPVLATRQKAAADVVSMIPARTGAAAVVQARTALQEQVAVFTPQPGLQSLAQRAARPLPSGLPEPSIIVGVIRDEDAASFPNAQSADLPAYDDVEGRRRLRSSSPERFASMVAAGAFDPPPELLARALQAELARMGCYTSRIDGDWGRGSQAAARRYFEAGGGGQPRSLQVSAEMFRQIISQEDVTCARPVAAAPRTSSSGGNTQRTQSQTRPAATAAPPQQPAGTIAPGTTLGGVFR